MKALGVARQSKTASPRGERVSLLIEHENLDDKIYARLKRMIADGQLVPGQRIRQEKLASEMGVSRTPLVNALKRLAQEHLIEWVSRRGNYVKQFTMRVHIRRSVERLWQRARTEEAGR